MPTTVEIDRSSRTRGPSRKYDMTKYLQQSLDSGKGLRFSAEEMSKDWKVKGQAVASAARKDAERMTAARDDGKTVKVFTRLVDRDGEDGNEKLTQGNGRFYQDLLLQAELVDSTDSLNAGEGSESGSGTDSLANAGEDEDTSETPEAPAPRGRRR